MEIMPTFMREAQREAVFAPSAQEECCSSSVVQVLAYEAGALAAMGVGIRVCAMLSSIAVTVAGLALTIFSGLVFTVLGTALVSEMFDFSWGLTHKGIWRIIAISAVITIGVTAIITAGLGFSGRLISS